MKLRRQKAGGTAARCPAPSWGAGTSPGPESTTAPVTPGCSWQTGQTLGPKQGRRFRRARRDTSATERPHTVHPASGSRAAPTRGGRAESDTVPPTCARGLAVLHAEVPATDGPPPGRKTQHLSWVSRGRKRGVAARPADSGDTVWGPACPPLGQTRGTARGRLEMWRGQI